MVLIPIVARLQVFAIIKICEKKEKERATNSKWNVKDKKGTLKVYLKLLKWIKKMSKRYSGKSFKDSSAMKKAKLSLKEKRKFKKEKKKK